MLSLQTKTREELLKMTQAQRREEFQHTTLNIQSSLMYAAEQVTVMDEAGDDLSQFPSLFVSRLRAIAQRQMLPEVFLKFKIDAQARIAVLPLAEQQAILDGKGVEMVVLGNGPQTYDVRLMSPLTMLPNQLKQVFSRDHKRSAPEQIAYLEEQRTKRSMSEVPADFKIDKKQKGVWVHGKFVSIRQMADWIAEIS